MTAVLVLIGIVVVIIAAIVLLAVPVRHSEAVANWFLGTGACESARRCGSGRNRSGYHSARSGTCRSTTPAMPTTVTTPTRNACGGISAASRTQARAKPACGCRVLYSEGRNRSGGHAMVQGRVRLGGGQTLYGEGPLGEVEIASEGRDVPIWGATCSAASGRSSLQRLPLAKVARKKRSGDCSSPCALFSPSRPRRCWPLPEDDDHVPSLPAAVLKVEIQPPSGRMAAGGGI